MSGIVTFMVDVQSPEGVRKVVFWNDKTKLVEDNDWPYEVQLDMDDYGPNETLRLVARARLNNGERLKAVVRVKTPR